MSSKYDKSVSISHEKEGSYHRREYEHTPAKPSKTTTTKHYSSQIVPVRDSSSNHTLRRADSSADEDNFEEWTTSKRKVNHKTRQVETRVSRQILVEDGKVIADSGPQVTTRIKEDNKVEECEKEKAPKNKGKFDAILNAPECDTANGRVLGEKKEIQHVTREVREENMQYHDERFKELSGHDVHRKAMKSPHELITITDKDSHTGPPRGKMVHYSNKGKVYRDKDEILEVAKLDIDGSITKEVKRTHHHEEESEDEQPDEKGEADKLRKKPVELKSNRRVVDYVNDFDNTATPPESSGDEIEGDHQAIRRHQQERQSGSRGRHNNRSDEAFPRYNMEPLLNSLNDNDNTYRSSKSSSGARRLPLQQKNRVETTSSDSDSDDRSLQRFHEQRQSSLSPRIGAHTPVEIPEEYKINKQRMLNKAGKSPSPSLLSTGSHKRNQQQQQPQPERSFSPSNKSQSSHKSGKHVKTHRVDASVQARLNEGSLSKSQRVAPLNKSVYTDTADLDENYDDDADDHVEAKHMQRELENEESLVKTSGGASKRKSRKSGSKSNSKRKEHRHADKDRDNEELTVLEQGRHSQHLQLANNNDNISICSSSLGPNATTIKVPYKHHKHELLIPAQQHAPIIAENIATSSNKQQHSSSSSSSSDREETDKPEMKSNRLKRNMESKTQEQRDHMEKEDNDETTSLVKKIPIEVEKRPRSESIKVKKNREKEVDHFDYRTIIKTLQQEPRQNQQILPNSKQNVVDAYNVRVIQHNSPFLNAKQEPVKSVSDLSTSIARLELLSSELSLRKPNQTAQASDNNNDGMFDLNEFVKHKTNPIQPDDSGIANSSSYLDDDRVSLISSVCSLRSSRTYNISTAAHEDEDDVDAGVELLDDDSSSINNNANDQTSMEQSQDRKVDDEIVKENGKLSAWIFDPRDNSTTAIVAPPKPKKPEGPKIETEDIGEARGGRSYYLELIEKEPATSGKKISDSKKATTLVRKRPSSMDSSTNSRWSSQNNLNKQSKQPQRQSTPTQDLSRQSRQMHPAKLLPSKSNHSSFTGINVSNDSRTTATLNNKRRQLPFSGPPLTNRSKSSSCLLSTSTKPSKYSIYGGLRKENNSNKPVPRLSYSRAIGPKSQRQIDAQSKVPSRYLKMK